MSIDGGHRRVLSALSPTARTHQHARDEHYLSHQVHDRADAMAKFRAAWMEERWRAGGKAEPDFY